MSPEDVAFFAEVDAVPERVHIYLVDLGRAATGAACAASIAKLEADLAVALDLAKREYMRGLEEGCQEGHENNAALRVRVRAAKADAAELRARVGRLVAVANAQAALSRLMAIPSASSNEELDRARLARDNARAALRAGDLDEKGGG